MAITDTDYPTPKSSASQDAGPGALMTGVTGFNRGVERITSGVMDLTARALGADKFQQTLKNLERQREAELELAKTKHPLAGGIGELLGGIAITAPIPGGVAGGLGKRMLTGALAGAGVGGA